ncbi:MFS transporter [Rhodococcus sp. 06-235-1A]|uniref:MFS transporter n=1 Tax=Rhodococcus sp. 06-235-1A TaxID=2022508 RepID=UPI0015C665AA|nr:MFS transporter [Rhodococcus sp. 06-235-1A]
MIGSAGRWLIGGATIQSLGEALYDLLIPLLVLQITGSPVIMAAVFVVGYCMEIIVGIVGGVIVDRINRRTLLICIAALQAAVMLGCALLDIATGALPLWALFVTAAAIDFLVRLYLVADAAALPQVVGSAALPRANGLMQSMLSTTQVAGPLIGGLALEWIDLRGALLLTTVVYVALAIFVGRIPLDTTKVATNPTTIIESYKQAWRVVLDNSLLRRIVIWRGAFDFVIAGAFLMLLFLLQGPAEQSSSSVGVIVAIGAVGGIVGGLGFAQVQAAVPSWLVLASGAALMCGALASLAFARSSYILAAATFVLFGALSVVRRLLAQLFQSAVPNEMLGRVTAVSQLIASVVGPISVAIAAALSDSGRISILYIGSAIGVAALVAALAFGPLRGSDWGIRNQSVTQPNAA